MSEQKLEVCILAAGMGTRMKSTIPKVLQVLAGKPLLSHLLASVQTLGPKKIHVVVGPESESLKTVFCDDGINWVTQTERRGTGHALMQALPDIADNSKVLILLGDAPLVSARLMKSLIEGDTPLSVLTVCLDDPTGYGRIVRSGSDCISQIVEDRDANEAEAEINEINTGVMVADVQSLREWLPQLKADNAQNELLLTDLVSIASGADLYVRPVLTEDAVEVAGVNSFAQLAELERVLQRRYAHDLMNEGVHIVDPERFDLRGHLSCGRDVFIDVNNVFEGDVTLGDGVRIGANCRVINSVIEPGSVIKDHSHLEGCQVGPESQVGPFARLRPGTVLRESVAIGNFVEVKNSEIGKGTKASHLTYLGDASIGESVNIGAGTITCNYDGIDKHRTRIEDHVFIGSNTALVAPVVIGAGSIIGAGSTITKDVKEGVLALSRVKQKSVINWKRPEDEK